MKYLIIGSEGFLGRVLCKYLSSVRGASVIRADIRKTPSADTVSRRYRISLEETEKMAALCKREKPDVVFNLAGNANAKSMEEQFNLHCLLPIKFLEASAGQRFKIIFIGSAAEYGIMRKGEKIYEDAPLRPLSDYGISKACQTFMALRFAKNGILPKVIIARPFNIIGAGMSENLFLGAFAKQIAMIERGLQAPIIKVGNLESYRDVLSSDTAARYLDVLAGHGKHGEIYNICSGRPMKIREMLEKLLKLSSENIRVTAERGKFRTNEIPWSVGSNKKIAGLTKMASEDSSFYLPIKETLDWFRERAPAS